MLRTAPDSTPATRRACDELIGSLVERVEAEDVLRVCRMLREMHRHGMLYAKQGIAGVDKKGALTPAPLLVSVQVGEELTFLLPACKPMLTRFVYTQFRRSSTPPSPPLPPRTTPSVADSSSNFFFSISTVTQARPPLQRPNRGRKTL